jgi:phosphohistidine phosphatase SixA
MDDELDGLTRDGTVPHDAYRAMREAIQRVTDQSGRLYEVGHEAHYQALAAAMALRAAGYSIQKAEPNG